MIEKIFGIKKLKEELKYQSERAKEEYERANKEREELFKKMNQADLHNNQLKQRTMELDTIKKELDQSVTAEKIKTVLRTLELNGLKPKRIVLNDIEMSQLEHHRDVIKAKNKGKVIYDVRIVKDSKIKRPFVITVENKKLIRKKRK